jgi:hypothetical protein
MSAPATETDTLRQLVELLGRLTSEVHELRAELGRGSSPWMTTEEAADWLKVSRDTLDKYAASHGHLEGGPVNVGEHRKVLRWSRETIDGWFRQVAGIAAPKVARKPALAPRATAAKAQRFDWTAV